MSEKSGSENIVSKMVEFQDEMFDLWKRTVFSYGQSQSATAENTSQHRNTYFDFFNKWTKLNNDSLLSQNLDLFGVGAFYDTMHKLVNTNELYLTLFRFWGSLNMVRTGSGKKGTTLLEINLVY